MKRFDKVLVVGVKQKHRSHHTGKRVGLSATDTRNSKKEFFSLFVRSYALLCGTYKGQRFFTNCDRKTSGQSGLISAGTLSLVVVDTTFVLGFPRSGTSKDASWNH